LRKSNSVDGQSSDRHDQGQVLTSHQGKHAGQVEGAEIKLLGDGSTIATSVRPLTWIAEAALKDERMLPYLGLFQAGLLQPGKQPLSARPNDRRLLFVFCQARRLANDQERCI